MTKLKNNIICFIIVISCILCIPKISVSAYKKELKANLAACKFKCTQDFLSTIGLILPRSGAASWMSNSLPFTLNWGYRASGSATAYCDTLTDFNQEFIGVTLHYSNSVAGKIDPEKNDWNYAFIYANLRYPSTMFSAATFAHEFGHVMGLSHSNNEPSTIMCQEVHGRTAQIPSSVDLARLAIKYRKRK